MVQWLPHQAMGWINEIITCLAKNTNVKIFNKITNSTASGSRRLNTNTPARHRGPERRKMIKRWNAAPPPRHGGRIPSQDAFISQVLRTFLSSSSHWPTGAPFYPPPVAWPHQQSYRLRSSSFCRHLSPPCTKPARLAKRSTFSLLLHPFVCYQTF